MNKLKKNQIIRIGDREYCDGRFVCILKKGNFPVGIKAKYFTSYTFRRPIKTGAIKQIKSRMIKVFTSYRINELRREIEKTILSTWCENKEKFKKRFINSCGYQYEIEITVKKLKVKKK